MMLGQIKRLPSEIAAALGGWPPALARRALEALETVTEPLRASAGPAAWSSSGLTGDGFPVELVFSTVDGGARWVCDPVPPGSAPAARLAVALAAARQARACCDPDLLARAAGPQEGRTDAFGAWIGGRHSGSGDRWKLYIDLPEGPQVDPLLAELGLNRPRIPAVQAVARMLGIAAASAEVYYRIALPAQALANLLEPVERTHAAPMLADAIAEAYGRRIGDRLPGGEIGVSYARSSNGAPEVTLYFFARILWGSDRRIRERMLARFTAAGQPLEPYETATRPLVEANSAQTCHGLVGITLAGGGLHWSVGLRPPRVKPC